MSEIVKQNAVWLQNTRLSLKSKLSCQEFRLMQFIKMSNTKRLFSSKVTTYLPNSLKAKLLNEWIRDVFIENMSPQPKCGHKIRILIFSINNGVMEEKCQSEFSDMAKDTSKVVSLDKSGYLASYFHYFTRKHMLWILIGSVSLRRFQWARQQMISCRNKEIRVIFQLIKTSLKGQCWIETDIL